MKVLHERDAPHRTPSREPCFVGRQPATAMLFFEQRQMGRDLAIDPP